MIAAALIIQVLSFTSAENLDRYVGGGFVTRLVLAHRGPIKPRETTFLPIVVRGAQEGEELEADFQVFASDGRLVLNQPKCCRASKQIYPGIWLLEPVPQLLLLPSDVPGLYTAVATVRGKKARERLVLTQ